MPASEPDVAALRSWLTVVESYHLCSELLGRRLGELGLRTAEHEVLANLQREPGLSQQALARRCFTAKSQISALVGELETRGWLRREPDPHDARARRLFLTDTGAGVATQTAEVQADVVALMASAATPEAIAQVQTTMQAINTRLLATLRSR